MDMGSRGRRRLRGGEDRKASAQHALKRRVRVVGILSDRAVPDPLDGLIDHEQRNEEPLVRNDTLSEAILDLDVEARQAEDPVDQILKRAVDVVEHARRPRHPP
jgi:hypothetical protein